jgi:hypothetical protein
MGNRAEMAEALINPMVTTGKGHPTALAVTMIALSRAMFKCVYFKSNEPIPL